MDKLRNDEFDWRSQGGNLQSLIERYGYGAAYAAALAAMGMATPQEYLDEYVTDPIKKVYNEAEELFVNPLVEPERKEGGLVKANLGRIVKSGINNLYKINPLAEKLNNVNKSYRVAGIDALKDFQNTGVLRSVQQGLSEGASLIERAMSRPTSFPSFQKGYADMRYAPEEGAVVFETGLPTFKRGEINPVTGFPIKGRHYAHRVIDLETGAALREIPAFDIRVFGDKPHWFKGYQEIPKQLPGSPNVDFSKYLTQEEAVAARSERLISQKNKLGWNEQLTPELEQRLSNAVKNHNPASDYAGESLGANTMGRTATEVSKDAISKQGIPLNDANKARVAAHETGHYYVNSPAEGKEWASHFDFSKLSQRSRDYLMGKGWKGRNTDYANEVRERAAQLKDYIAQKNGIPLNQDFEITQVQLDDAIKNYIKDTGLDNTMSEMLGALKNKKGFLKTMNKFALGTISAVIGAETLQQKKQGGATNDYIELDLTPEEIKNLIAQGYVIEEHN